MANVDVSMQNNPRLMAKPSTFSVEDTYWGYVIRSGRGPSLSVMLLQLLSFFFGACFLTAAIGMLLMPVLAFDGDIGAFRLGAATIFAAIAIYLLWFASRGTRAEIHVDNSVGEIREVICNRAGKPTVIGTYGFDTIGGVFLEPREDSRLSALVLRYRSTMQSVTVAEGTEAQLLNLRNRLGQDLMLVPATLAAQEAAAAAA